MSAFFVSGSSQRLTNTAPPITGYPFTVGFYAEPTTNAVGTLFCLTDTGTTNNYLMIRQSATSNFAIVARAGGTETAATGAAVVLGQKFYVVGRFISATNRRLDILRTTQGIETHNQSTTSRAPTGLDEMNLGALNTSGGLTEFYDGHIGEFWFTNTDIQPDGAALTSPTLWQLAYGGPFSIPHVAQSIVEYRSLRKFPNVDGDEIGEWMSERFGRQTWANNGGVTISRHDPLPYWYERPGQRRRLLVA